MLRSNQFHFISIVYQEDTDTVSSGAVSTPTPPPTRIKQDVPTKHKMKCSQSHIPNAVTALQYIIV